MAALLSVKALEFGLRYVSPFIHKKTTLPILTCIYVDQTDDTMTISGTDLQHALVIRLRSYSSERLRFACNCKDFEVALKSYHSERSVPISVFPESGIVMIGENEIRTFPEEEWVPIEQTSANVNLWQYTFDMDHFKEGVNYVIDSSSTDMARPVLQSVYVEIDDDNPSKPCISATDGFRISYYNLIADIPGHKSFLLYQPTMKQFLRCTKKLISDVLITGLGTPSSGDSVQQQRIQWLSKETIGEVDWLIVAQPIDGAYPPYRAIIPKNNMVKVLLNRQAFINSLVSIVAYTKSGNVPYAVYMGFKQDPGDVTGSARVLYKNEDVAFDRNLVARITNVNRSFWWAFDPRMMTEILETISDEQIYLLMPNAVYLKSPVKIIGAGFHQVTQEHIIMPMHGDNTNEIATAFGFPPEQIVTAETI